MLFSRWWRRCAFEDGYTIVLPSPMDMPFLLRYALEGLAHLNTENCRQILVVPDGCVDDGVTHSSGSSRHSTTPGSR